MRSRERLIEVMRTVNPALYSNAKTILRATAYILNDNIRPSEDLKWALLCIRSHHASPHIRELAAEALHYLKEGTSP